MDLKMYEVKVTVTMESYIKLLARDANEARTIARRSFQSGDYELDPYEDYESSKFVVEDSQNLPERCPRCDARITECGVDIQGCCLKCGCYIG